MIVNALCRTYSSLRIPKAAEPSAAADGNARAAGQGSAAQANRFGLSPRRTASEFETAKKFVSAVIENRKGSKEGSWELLQTEKKKSLKFSLALLASPLPVERIARAYAEAGLAGSDDGAEECECQMLMEGVKLALGGAHPAAILRAMTAYLGFPVFDAAEAWLVQRFESQGGGGDELIVPGELPDLVAEFEENAGLLSQAFRMAGPKLTAAALAGCPGDTAGIMKAAALGRLGSLLLDTEIVDARSRLSSEELADAQDAFCTLLGSLKEPERRLEAGEEDVGRGMDRGLVSDLSQLIMELDDKALKTVVTALEPELAAALIQTMTPVAHDRLFSSVPQNRSKRILDALENAAPLGAVELTRDAQLFAQKVLAELVPRTKPLGKAVPLPAKLREVLTAILSRE